MTIDEFIVENADAIENEFHTNWNDMAEAIRTVAKRNYESWLELYNKTKNNTELKMYLMDCILKKEVPFVC